MSPRLSQEQIIYAIGDSSLGGIVAAHSPRGVVLIALADNAVILGSHVHSLYPQAIQQQQDARLQQTLAKLISFVDALQIELDLPLDIRGTAFQQRVWQALREIPVGATCSYGQLARQIGAPTAVRAVAGACAANRLALVIPCHRVVGANGKLSGYRWGVERKAALLSREQQVSLPGKPMGFAVSED
jgi:AraC family transcriptional regulator of adaptative response/methylated-DNA-[protein]-cysteine methyltransferase